MRSGDHDDVLAGMDRVDGLRLVGVERRDAALGQAAHDPRVEPAGIGAVEAARFGSTA